MKQTNYFLLCLCVILALWSCEQSMLDEQVDEFKPNDSQKQLSIESVIFSYQSPILNEYGILEFKNQRHFRQQSLALEKLHAHPDYQYDDKFADDCSKESKALDEFEKILNYSSLRTKYIAIQCAQLERGIEKLEQLTMNPIPDDVLATMLNKYGEVMIGDDIYVFKTLSLYMRTKRKNIDEVIKLRSSKTSPKVNFAKFDVLGNATPDVQQINGTQTNFKISVRCLLYCKY